MNKRKVFNRLLRYYKNSWSLLILVFFLIVFSSFANIYGTFMLRDVIDAIDNCIKDTSNEELYKVFLNNILKMMILYACAVIALFSYTQIMIRISQKVIYQIRKDLIEHVEKMPISYFDKHKRGEIMTYFTNDISTLYDSLNISFANIIFSFCNIAGTITCMFLINPYLSLIVCAFMFAEFIFIFINGHFTQKYYLKTQNELGQVNAISEEDINGLKVIKAFNHKETSYLKFNDANEKLRDAATKSFYHTAINTPVISSLAYFNFAISCIIGCVVLVNGNITFGALSSYLVYVRQSSQPFNFFTQHVNNILTALSGSERIFTFLDTPIEEDNGKVTLVKTEARSSKYADRYSWQIPQDDGTFKVKPLRGQIEFKHVTFGYNENKIILHDINFIAHVGDKLAFVGPTGAGKTTIISLISRFYNINQGEIIYDGINIKDMKLESLRKSISCVTQDTHLFTGTIKDNIRYVRMHSTDNEVYNAAIIANANNFISRLPLNYDTMLYDDGHNLSEGQRQLLALARAAISQPPVLVLDEATSNIDTRTEKLVNNAMGEIMKDRTSLIIAHRLSTIRNCTNIIVMENGSIKEKGTHDELIKLKGLYYELDKGTKELS
ncbi:MAG: ABC transporter ATP-binding protein [Bacilli bacterium]